MHTKEQGTSVNIQTTEKKVPISVVVLAKNEEKRLPDCLESVKWAEEILVLNDESTDNTVSVAESFGAKVYNSKMDNEGIQRNYANTLVTQPWVLSIDADERVTPELAVLIRQMTEKTEDSNVCYAVKMKNYIGDEWITGAGYYPAFRCKIFRKGQLKYGEEKVHPPVRYEGSCGRLDGDLLHYTSRDFEHWLSKFNRETTLEAEKWVLRNQKIGPWRVYRKAVSRFLKFYFQKGGIKTGYTGFVMSCFHSLYQLITFMKFRELKRKNS